MVELRIRCDWEAVEVKVVFCDLLWILIFFDLSYLLFCVFIVVVLKILLSKVKHFGHLQTWQISVLNRSQLLRKRRLRKLRRPDCLANLLRSIKSFAPIFATNIRPIQHILSKQIISTLSIITNILHDFILYKTYKLLFHLLLIFFSYAHFFYLDLQLYYSCLFLADYLIFLANYVIY